MSQTQSSVTAPDLVRAGRRNDLPAVAAIQARSLSTDYSAALPHAAADALNPVTLTKAWTRHLDQNKDGGQALWVACHGVQVVGFLCTQSVEPAPAVGAPDHPCHELMALYVDPDHQRRGHASRLLSAAAQQLAQDGPVDLEAWILEGDVPRQTFFTSAGFGHSGAARVLHSDDGTSVRELRYVSEASDRGASA